MNNTPAARTRTPVRVASRCVTTGSLLALAVAFGLLVAGCTSAPRRAAAPQPAGSANGSDGATSKPGSESSGSGAAPAPASGDDKVREEAKRTRERQRKLARLERSAEVAQLNLAKAQFGMELGELRYNDVLAQAEKEHELAQRRLEIFEKFTGPNRIARSELGLKYAEDGLTDAREELRQLELMYKEDQFADQTKEIVIDRARRQLERSQRDFELRQGEHKILIELTLPLERIELEHQVRQKRQVVLQTQRDNEPAAIDRRTALLNADAEVSRLEEEIADTRDEIEEAARKAATQPAP
jgi:hypothetical protein